MPKTQGQSKNLRILNLYERFNQGEILFKNKLADEFQVDKRSIQRDIKDLNQFLDAQGDHKEILYNKGKKGYELKNRNGVAFADREIFAICKILFESRAFSDNEMDQLLNVLVNGCDERKQMMKIIANERYHYVPLSHNKDIIDYLWKMIKSIQDQQIMNITYEKQDKTEVSYDIKPLGLIFNEYYFYLMAEKCGNDAPFLQAFRVDRFKSFNETEGDFKIEYKDRFQEGDFRKKIQFMYTGKLEKITFKFWGDSLEAVLDRLVTAKVIGQEDGKAIIEAEVYGDGVRRWLLTQQEYLEVIRPDHYRAAMKDTISKMLANYDN